MPSSPLSISFLIVCKDNFDEVVSTFNSIYMQMHPFDELIVVDSSSSDNIKAFVAARSSETAGIVYEFIPPSGVYDAQNHCILLANNDWICFINSGDILLKSGRDVFYNVMSSRIGYPIYVFGQYFSFRGGKSLASFFPNKSSLWPHQSIVYKKQLHNIYGDYDISFRYSADQLFFAIVRKHEDFCITKERATLFYTDGLSSGFSLSYAKELWCIYRILDYGLIKSVLCSLVLPFLKALLKPFLSKQSIQNFQEIASRFKYLR